MTDGPLPTSQPTEGDEIRRERDRFRELVEITSDWVWEVDASGRYTYTSPQCRNLLGYEPEEILGRTLFDLMPPPEAARVRRDFLACVAARRPISGLINVNLRKDGTEVVLETGGVPLLSAEGRLLGYRGVDRDVTERHRAYLALEEFARQSAREKERAEKENAAKSRFLAVMSHELRTPLNAIIGFSEEMLHEDFGPLGDPHYREYAQDIRDSGRHLLAIVNDILEHAKLEAGAVELEDGPVSAHDLLGGVMRMLRPLSQPRGVLVRVEIADGFPTLRGDARRLQQAVLNLAANAVRFSAEGMAVTLSAGLADDGVPLLRVADHGPGMTPAELEVALSAFGQAHQGHGRAPEGTGLGLPIAVRIAELHGGSLEVRSAPGQGTTVTIALPGRLLR
ncbi:PAS domain-containing sensor histidine kinase [Azospirillum sp. SYSU D00513]|uniref:PAS domain-containing sensor histidine kinase n=1 Tax=Azospirillum sp. SYSU D00513 TaxID=2812561 RepID=UPI001A9580C2|nr:PAS domain-containing sensor histidine kinase [Azospirillum sp. SYSU D00513]